MAAEDTVFQNFLVYKLGTAVVVAGVLWYFRKALKYYTYQKLFAWFMNRFTKKLNKGLAKYKTQIFQTVKDHQERVNKSLSILEVGCGSASNLEFFPFNTKLVCLDPNPHFVGYIEKNLKQHDTVITAEIVQGIAEDMPFDDAQFDVVVSTLVLCSVSDVKKSLAEIKRVLKPGGVFVFLEHVADKPNTRRHMMQRFMNPLHRFFGDGCEVLRETGKDIEAATFSRVNIETFIPKILPYWIKPLIMGSATK